MIGAKLSLKAVSRMAKWCGHHAGIGDDHIEGFPFCQQLICARTHALKVGKVEFNQFEPSAIGCGVFSHLLGSSFGLVQIPRRAYNLSAVGGQRPSRFYSEPGGNTRYEDPLPLPI